MLELILVVVLLGVLLAILARSGIVDGGVLTLLRVLVVVVVVIYLIRAFGLDLPIPRLRP